MTDLTIRVIDQMRKASDWEPLPRDIRETYAPWTLEDEPGKDKPNGGGKKEGEGEGGDED
jgi:hypothetical protein